MQLLFDVCNYSYYWFTSEGAEAPTLRFADSLAHSTTYTSRDYAVLATRKTSTHTRLDAITMLRNHSRFERGWGGLFGQSKQQHYRPLTLTFVVIITSARLTLTLYPNIA